MSSLAQRYLDVCSDLDLSTNPYILRVLRDTEKQPSGNRLVQLTGNNRLVPVQKLTDNDVLALSGTLRDDVPVTGLDLRYNRITDEGAKHLADLLQTNAAIQSLNLMCNDIDAEGAEFIAKILQKNETLQTLRMTGNKIGDKGAMHFATMLQINSTLEELDVSDCDLGTQSLIAFAIVLSRNKSIHAINVSRPLLFSYQEETTVHFARMLQVNTHLKELHLGKHGITDSGVERLCEVLRDNFILRYLDLRCNRITRDGAKALAQVLKQNCTLEILDLSSNRIEDDGALYLGKAVAQHSCSLKALSVTSNNIGSQGLVSIAKAMRDSASLSHIYIWGNKLKEPVCEAISSLIQSGRLLPEATDVTPYEVDGHLYLAETSHGLRRHYYWAPSFGTDGDPTSNSALALMEPHRGL